MNLKILHVEDSEDDCELLQRMLADENVQCDVKRVETREEFFDSLQHGEFDVILSDCALPKFSGMEALTLAKALKPEVPFIFVSGTMGEDAAIQTLTNGATDYVLKDKLSRLVPAMQRAVKEAEERRVCQEMVKSLRNLRRIEVVGTLAGGIAHHFNNLLTVIVGHASLLKKEGQENMVILERTDTIIEAAQRGADLVEQLLAFARKSQGRFVITDLNQRIWTTIAGLSKTLTNNIDYIVDLAPKLPAIFADEAQISRMLNNVLVNAQEAMPSGGQVTISTKLVPEDELPTSLPRGENKSYVCLNVTDTGMGMDEEKRQHVFEPFYTTKAHGVGTGLGLPVVFGFMKSHNGAAEIKSEVGKGTSVLLYFPVSPEQITPVSKLADNLPSPLNGDEAVLVVEDEPELATFVKGVLRSHGYRPVLAETPSQGIQFFTFSKEDFKLVICDVSLPEMDGFELCTKIKAINPNVKIILVSGEEYGTYDEKIAKLGINAWVPKPYKADEILTSVRMALDR